MKTPVRIIKGKRRSTHDKPAFINGTLSDRRKRGIRKVLVYHFDEDGELLVDLIPIKFVQSMEFELEG